MRSFHVDPLGSHVFHPDCLQPWLKVNGSCPVWYVLHLLFKLYSLFRSRFSLVPDEDDPTRSRQRNTNQNQGGPPTVTGLLQRLWGQNGTASTRNPTSPTDGLQSTSPAPSQPPQHIVSSSPSRTPTTNGPPVDESTNSLGPSEQVGQQTSSFHTDIPDDYRDRHRRREAEQARHPQCVCPSKHKMRTSLQVQTDLPN